MRRVHEGTYFIVKKVCLQTDDKQSFVARENLGKYSTNNCQTFYSKSGKKNIFDQRHSKEPSCRPKSVRSKR
jgi:hypothetical protein